MISQIVSAIFSFVSICFFTEANSSTIPSLHICRNCNHFFVPFYKGEYALSTQYGKCAKFTKIIPFLNECDYVTVIEARQNETMCGNSGKLFEKRK
jgi:hypothetical protein